MRLDAITTFAIERYKKRRVNEGAANATINRELATLSHIFSKAVEWHWLDHVPARPKRLRESAGRIIALTDEQCDALIRTAIASADPDCWLFVVFGLNTAMRHSEILGARWDHLDLVNRRLFIPDAKTGEREQPITPSLLRSSPRSWRCAQTAEPGSSRRRTRIVPPVIAPAWIVHFVTP
jgi:integrase